MPEGDNISYASMEALSLAPVTLPLTDVLTGLQTGLIDTVYNAFYGAIVLQWFTRTKYITDIPFAYGYGAIALDQKTFAKLTGKEEKPKEEKK